MSRVSYGRFLLHYLTRYRDLIRKELLLITAEESLSSLSLKRGVATSENTAQILYLLVIAIAQIVATYLVQG